MADDRDLPSILFEVITGAFIWALALLLNGFVVSKLWNWFLVIDFGLHAITMYQGLALQLVVYYLVQQTPTEKKDDAKTASPYNQVGYSIGVSGMILLSGYVLHNLIH